MIVDVDGVRGVCEVTGNGPPLVLLASPLARAKTYRTTAEALGRTFQVFAVELPGTGRADAVGGGWPVERYAEWTAGLVAKLGLDRPLVIGHSHSAATAAVMAARHPGVAGRLVLVDATGTGPHPFIRVFAGVAVDILLELRIVLTRWHHVAGNLLRHPRNFVRQIRGAIADDIRPDLPRARVPVLLAWGKRDHTLPPTHAWEYARHLPNARVHLSPGGSHDWLISRSDEFAAVVARFAG